MADTVLRNFSHSVETRYPGVFKFADYEYEFSFKISKFKMVDPIWRIFNKNVLNGSVILNF